MGRISVHVGGPQRCYSSTDCYAHGYDNRNTTMMGGVTNAKGIVQLVSPTLTRWLQPCCKFETGGVGILRIKFIPEPQM